MSESALFERDGEVATIALNLPEVLKAFNGALYDEIHNALNDADEDDGIRCIVLRGECQMFCGYMKDYKEDIGAFFEKREPVFTGR